MEEINGSERDGVCVGVLPSPFGVPVPQPPAERSRQVRVTSIKPKITSWDFRKLASLPGRS
jgi:hypothetical protein